ncbi:MAG: PTS sugar transporter subunit IIA [Planctomycetes bacterium]|nr:PTS sugar transporter subunit IIA [Planctomycetota bacterium]
MNIRRFLRVESIRLAMRTTAIPREEESPDSPRFLQQVREAVLREIVELLDASGQVGNPNRLFTDLHNREKKASTALGSGVAMPHVRTIQAKSFVMAFGRAAPGLPFFAPDIEPVRLFFALVSPPYEDKTYLRVYQHLGHVLLDPERKEWLLSATEETEILRILEAF